MKKLNLLLLIVYICCAKNIQAQQTGQLLYSDIPVLFNMDSVEKAVATTPKNNPQALFLALVTLEKSSYSYYAPQFGTHFKAIDSLAKIIGTSDAKAIALYFPLLLQIINEVDRELLTKNWNTIIGLAEKQKDTALLVNCYHNLMLLNIRGNYGAKAPIKTSNKLFAKKYFTTIVQLASISTNPNVQLSFNIASVDYYFKIDTNNNKVLEAANKGLKIIENNPKYVFKKGFLLASLATYYYMLENYEKVLEYDKLCLTIPTSSNATTFSTYYYNIANDYYKLSKNDSAKLYFNKAILFIKTVDTSNLVTLDDCYYTLAELEFGQKNYKTAYSIKLLADSVYSVRTSRENQTKFVELEHKYESDKKDQANAILNQKQAQYKMLGIIGLLVFMFIVAMLFLFYKQNKKLAKLVIFRDKIHTIISHDLRSPFAALQDLNEQASHYLKTNDIKQFNNLAINIDSTSIKISNLLNNLLQWAITNNKKDKNNLLNVNVASVVNNVVQLYANTINSKKVLVNKPINNTAEVTINKNILELVVRNWLDNVLKYANATQVSFEIEDTANAVKMVIVDNGIISTEIATIIKNQLSDSSIIKMENDTGLGLSLIAYFAKENNFTVQLNEALNNNVLIVEIPKKRVEVLESRNSV